MSVTLLPITAILLLLSGIGGPVRAAGSHAGVAVLGGYWLGVHPDSAATRAGAPRHRSLGTCASFYVETAAPRLASAGAPLLAAGSLPRSRKLYITRFGFAEGAYQAIGPPQPASSALLA